MKLVSVVIPTYRRSDMLVGAVESVIAQTHDRLEILVGVDGASGQVEGAVKAFDDPRLRVFSWKRNRGQFAVNEDLLRIATGEYVCIFSDDDVMERNFILRCVESLEQTGADYVYADYFAWQGDRLEPRCAGLNMNATAFRRSTLEELRAKYGHIFPPGLRQYGDAVLLHRLEAEGRRREHVHEPLIRYRIHDQQITVKLTFQSILDQVRAVNLMHRRQTLKRTAELFLWLLNGKSRGLLGHVASLMEDRP
jgi:glycosyltransferase involved in cell wall biosynthesis